MERCNACGAMAISIAKQEAVGETSTVHFSGQCGNCEAKLKWHRKILADGPPARLGGRAPCPPDCPWHDEPI